MWIGPARAGVLRRTGAVEVARVSLEIVQLSLDSHQHSPLRRDIETLELWR
jgi:hypothetical protein